MKYAYNDKSYVNDRICKCNWRKIREGTTLHEESIITNGKWLDVNSECPLHGEPSERRNV